MHAYIYRFLNVMSGGNRFIQDIEMMIGKKSWWFWLYWRVCWYFFTPGITLVSTLLHTVYKVTPTHPIAHRHTHTHTHIHTHKHTHTRTHARTHTNT